MKHLYGYHETLQHMITLAAVTENVPKSYYDLGEYSGEREGGHLLPVITYTWASGTF